MTSAQKISFKIDLENLIFYCAAAERARLFFCCGKILTSGRGLLADLVRIYNCLFEEENKVFLAQEQAEEQRMLAWFKQEYLEEKKKNPTAAGFSLGIKNPR